MLSLDKLTSLEELRFVDCLRLMSFDGYVEVFFFDAIKYKDKLLVWKIENSYLILKPDIVLCYGLMSQFVFL